MDPLSGQNYEHRRVLIEQRIRLLAGCFALSVHAYAVMSNHLHLVIYTDPAEASRWNDDEVIARWRTALPSHKYDAKAPAVTDDPAAQPKVSAEWIADKRLRLASLSWFMKLLNENIAKRANAEDGCTGHFWESRFRSQALLDERAITAAMAYVDLNPRIDLTPRWMVPSATRRRALMSPARALRRLCKRRNTPASRGDCVSWPMHNRSWLRLTRLPQWRLLAAPLIG